MTLPILILFLTAADPVPASTTITLLETHLHAGTLAAGIPAVEKALANKPNDDQLRFGLGLLQFIHGVEKLGQSLHKYGVKPENTNVPFLRIPVPVNAKPDEVTYDLLRKVFEDFTKDMAFAEATLAKIKDDTVTLPLRLAAIKVDFTSTGKASEKFIDIVKKLMGGELEFLQKNPEFLVRFDRGDVAWLRSYCHLLSAMLDIYLSVDLQFVFDRFGAKHFEKPKVTTDKPASMFTMLVPGVTVRDADRLKSFRQHMLMVCELNRETWKYIRAEKDDDHEWLPNPKQKGVIGLAVSDEMIDRWLELMADLELLFKGEAVLDLSNGGEFGINLKTYCDSPPKKFELGKLWSDDVDPKYAGKLSEVKGIKLQRAIEIERVFKNNSSMLYAAWFN